MLEGLNDDRAFVPVDRPDCPECARAQADASHPFYRAECLGCACRGFAESPIAWRAVRREDPEPLREALMKAFGEAGYDDAKRRVWRWIQTLDRLRAESRQATPAPTDSSSTP